MPHMLLTRFERRVLRPVYFAHGAVIIILLLQLHFLVAVPLILLWFAYGMVGQVLHKDLSARQMARGEHLSSLADGAELEPISPEDSHQLGKAVMGLGFILCMTTTLLGVHLGLRWFFAILLGALAWFMSPILSIVLAGGDAFWEVWRNRRRKEGA